MRFTTLKSWLKKSASKKSTKPSRTRLGVEGLENRVVPATYTWTDLGATNNWDDAGNWSVLAGNPPTPTSGQAGGTIVNIPINDQFMFQNIDNLVINQLNFTNNGTATLTLLDPLGISGTFGAPGGFNVTNGAGTTNTINGLSDLVLTSNLDPYFNVSGKLTIDTAISGARNLVVTGGFGELELKQDNTYTGNTQVREGVVTLNSPFGGGHAIPDGTALFVGNGLTNALEGVVRMAAGSQLSSTTPITVDTDGGLLQINGADTVIGDLTLLGGQVSAGDGNLAIKNIHSKADQTISAAAGGFINLLNGQHTINVEGGTTLTITAPVRNAGGGAVGGIIKTGAGELAYHNTTATPNSYTGVTDVQNGTLSFQNSASNSAFQGNLVIGDGSGAAGSAVVRLDAISEIPNTATVTIRSDGKLDLNNKNETIGALSLSGGSQVVTGTGTLTLNGDITVFAGVTTAATVTGNLNLGTGDRVINVFNGTPASDLVIDGVISGGNMVMNGPGTFQMKGSSGTPNTYGTTTVKSGTLVLDDDGSNEAIPGSLFIGDGTGAAGSAVVILAQSAEIDNTVGVAVLSDGLFEFATNKFDLIGGLVLAGGEVRTKTGTLTVTGDIIASASPITSVISGNLSLGNAARTINTVGDLKVDAVVSAGGIIKIGAGKLTLNGNNTYTGDTETGGGTLVVNGTQAGSGVKTKGGVLAGSGVVGFVAGGGASTATVAPGGSPGTLTTKDFTLGTGHYAAEIAGTGASDQVKVTGAVNLTGGTLDLTVLNPTAIGQTITIIDNDLADGVTGNFVGLPQDATFTVAGRQYQIKYNGGTGNDVVLTDVTPNTPPTISDVTDKTDPSGAIPFTVGDAETAAANLQVTAEASNTTLFPAGSVVVGGNGANRTVTLSPAAGQFGTAVITLTATDANGGSATDTFTVTVSAPPPATLPEPYAVGGGAGAGSTVIVYNPDGTTKTNFQAFTPTFAGGVRTATGDVNGDGTPDVIVGAGPGRVAEVRVFDGVTNQQMMSNTPFADFTGGVFVAAGDFNNDGFDDIVITPDEGGGPRVTIVSGKDGAILSNFFAIDDANFRGGARAAVGDVNGDGTTDLVVSAGFGGGPRIAVFDGASLGGTPTKLVNDFFAFEPALRNGAYVAVGDLNADGKDDLIFGGGPGGGPRVLALDSAKALQGDTTGVLANFFAGNVDNRGGVRVAAKNLDNDAKADIVVGDGAGAGSRVTTYLGKDLSAPSAAFDAFPGFLGGVFVG